MLKLLCTCLLFAFLTGCQNQPTPGPGGTAYGPLGFIKQEKGTYLTPPPTAIDLNLKPLGALQQAQPQGDRTYIGWGLCAIRND